MSALKEKIDQAVWIAHSLYDRGKTSGSSANLSFMHDENIYVTVSGSCFGNLTVNDFACVDINCRPIDNKKASKEYMLHRSLYLKSKDIQAVIHIHSTYATLWSCLPHKNKPIVPQYTPYLSMKLGDIELVEYAKPGSQELFQLFADRVGEPNGYLLGNHGPIVGAIDLMEAYYGLEELEESCKIAWMLKDDPNRERYLISGL